MKAKITKKGRKDLIVALGILLVFTILMALVGVFA